MIHSVIHGKHGYNDGESRHVYTACETFLVSHGAPLGSIGKRIVANESIKPSVHKYRSLLAEYSLLALFEALGIQREWEVRYPIESEYLADNGIITPGGMGRRLDIRYDLGGGTGHTEVDGLVSIWLNDRESWAILEAKSGVQPPTIKEIQNQVKGVRTVTGHNPYHVLGVPKDNRILDPEDYNKDRRDEFVSKGGIVIAFNESAADFERKAQSMFDIATGDMSEERRNKIGVT